MLLPHTPASPSCQCSCQCPGQGLCTMPTWPRPGLAAGQAGKIEVTPSLSLEAQRPSLFLPTLEPGSATGPFPSRPTPIACSSSSFSAWGFAFLRNQDGLWEFLPCSDTHS